MDRSHPSNIEDDHHDSTAFTEHEKGPSLFFAPSSTYSGAGRQHRLWLSSRDALFHPSPQRAFQQQKVMHSEDRQLPKTSTGLINNDVTHTCSAPMQPQSAFQKKRHHQFAEDGMEAPRRRRMKLVDSRMGMLHVETSSPTSIIDDQNAFFIGRSQLLEKNDIDVDASSTQGNASPCDFMLACPLDSPSTPEHEKEVLSVSISDLGELKRPTAKYYDGFTAPNLCFPFVTNCA